MQELHLLGTFSLTFPSFTQASFPHAILTLPTLMLQLRNSPGFLLLSENSVSRKGHGKHNQHGAMGEGVLAPGQV